MSKHQPTLVNFLWSLWYRLFPVRPPVGKGGDGEPLLEMDDLRPLLLALGRLGQYDEPEPIERDPGE